jgi:hypothetical protein
MGGREDTKHWIFVFFIFPGDLSHTITSSHLVQKKKSIGADQHYLTPACSQWSAFLIFFKVKRWEREVSKKEGPYQQSPSIPNRAGPKLRTYVKVTLWRFQLLPDVFCTHTALVRLFCTTSLGTRRRCWLSRTVTGSSWRFFLETLSWQVLCTHTWHFS